MRPMNNGAGVTLRKHAESVDNPTVNALMEFPPWLQALRNANGVRSFPTEQISIVPEPV